MTDSSSSVDVATQFFRHFQAREGDAMASLYDPAGHFADPVFPDLTGAQAGQMWRMLTARGKDLAVTFEPPRVEGDRVIVPWIARYTFSATGRFVENHVTSSLRIVDGRIVDQRDEFDFARWASQALGLAGRLFGGVGAFQRFFQRRAAKTLADYRPRS